MDLFSEPIKGDGENGLPDSILSVVAAITAGHRVDLRRDGKISTFPQRARLLKNLDLVRRIEMAAREGYVDGQESHEDPGGDSRTGP